MKTSGCIALLVLCTTCAVAVYGDEQALTFIPKILSKPTVNYVNEGDSVVLNCTLDRMSDQLAIFIRKGLTPIISGRIMFFPKLYSMVFVEPATFLVTIKHVYPNSTGNYNCFIGHPDILPQNYSVNIIRPPKITQYPSTEEIDVIEGENVTLECNVEGNPMPEVKWFKDNMPHSEGVMGPNGEILNLPFVSRVDEAEYLCQASNKMAEDDKALFKLNVMFKPEIEIANEMVHVKEGNDTELICIIHASLPFKQVVWMDKDGNIIKTVSEYIAQRGSTHKLKLRLASFSAEDYGVYTCLAENDMGKSTSKVELSGVPHKAEIKSKNHSPLKNSYMLKWSVKSYNPITKYILKYREVMDGNNEFKKIELSPKSDPNDAMHEEIYEFNGLKEGTKYEVVLQAENKYGWNNLSEAFKFSTSEHNPTKPPTPIIKPKETTWAPVITNEIEVNAQAREEGVNSASNLSSSIYVTAFIITNILLNC